MWNYDGEHGKLLNNTILALSVNNKHVDMLAAQSTAVQSHGAAITAAAAFIEFPWQCYFGTEAAKKCGYDQRTFPWVTCNQII